MKLTFLGTSAGRPAKNRNVSAVALEIKNERGWYLFDCGEGTQQQILKTNLSIYKLKTVFITHIHGDHVYGLFGLITSRMLDKCTEPLKIYAPQGVKEMIESVVDVSREHLGYELEFVEIYGGFEEKFENFSVKVLPLIHSVSSYAFFIQQKDKVTLDAKKLQNEGLRPSHLYQEIKKGNDLETDGKKFVAKNYLKTTAGKRIIIAGDNAEPDILGKYLENLDLLVHEATYLYEDFLKLDKKYLHTTAKELGKVARKFGVKNLIATHISPRYEGEEILNEIRKYYEGNVFVARDFDVYVFYKNKIKKEFIYF